MSEEEVMTFFDVYKTPSEAFIEGYGPGLYPGIQVRIADYYDNEPGQEAVGSRKVPRTWKEIREILNRLIPENTPVRDISICGKDPRIGVSGHPYKGDFSVEIASDLISYVSGVDNQ